MQLDRKRHKLLKILSDKTLQFDIGTLPKNEPMGISFEKLMSEMKCDRVKLELISSELYKNEEIKVIDIEEGDGAGISCVQNGTVSFSNKKYKARYWKDILSMSLTVSQIIVPILALVIALVTVLDSRQSKAHTAEILQLRTQLYKQQEILNFQTKAISNLEYILKTDSLTKKLK